MSSNDQPTSQTIHSHGHQHHGHAHHHHHHGTHAQANQDYFNNNPDLYDTYPHAKERAKRTALAIADKVKLHQDNTTVLEFGCGNGLVCKELIPFVKTITGIDISEAGVKRFNETFEAQGVSDRVKAFAIDLEKDQSVIAGQKFDLVFCASAFHHFGVPQNIAKLLATFLKPSGTLVIVDNWLADGTDSKAAISEDLKHIVSHAGFTKEDMTTIFEGAGLKLDEYSVVPPDEGDNELFIAKGVFN